MEDMVCWTQRNNPNQWHSMYNLSDIMQAWYPDKIVLEGNEQETSEGPIKKTFRKWNPENKNWEKFEPQDSDRNKYVSFRPVLSVNSSESHLIVEGLSSNKFDNTFIGLHESNHFTSLFKSGKNYLYFDSFGSDANTKKHILDLMKQIDEKNPPTQSEKNTLTSLQAHLQNDSWHCGDWCFIPMLAFMKYGEVNKENIEKFVNEFGDGDIAKIRKINIILSLISGNNVQKTELEAFVKDAGLNTNAMEIINAHMRRISKPELDKSCFTEPRANKPIKITFLNDTKPSTSSVECSVNLNLTTGLKSPDPDTGKIFHLLTPESIAIYRTLKDVTGKWRDEKKKDCYLLIPKDSEETIEVYANHMTFPNPTEDGLKIMADAYMAAVEEGIKSGNSQVKKELWIDADEEATQFLTDYCSKKGYTIVKKPEVQPDKKPLASEPVEPLKEESSNTILRF